MGLKGFNRGVRSRDLAWDTFAPTLFDDVNSPEYPAASYDWMEHISSCGISTFDTAMVSLGWSDTSLVWATSLFLDAPSLCDFCHSSPAVTRPSVGSTVV